MDNYNYDIYFNKNYHDDVYNNGNYFDAIYLGNKLWWKKQSKIILTGILSIIEYNSVNYCLASFQSDDWVNENAMHQRYYISEIQGSTITPLFNVTPENIYSQKVKLIEVGKTGFLLAYINSKEKDLFTTIVPNESEKYLKYPFIKTDEKTPDFPCSYLVKIDKSHVEKRVSDGSNYYRQTYSIKPGEAYGNYIVSKWSAENNEMLSSYTFHKFYSVSNLIQSSEMGANISDFPFMCKENNIYFTGSYGSSSEIKRCFYLYGDINPISSFDDKLSSIKQFLYNDVSFNKPYTEVDGILYMYGSYYDYENKKYIDCIYSFDGTSLSVIDTMQDRFTQSTNFNKFNNISAICHNVASQSSNSTEKSFIKIIKGDIQKKIEIAPNKFIKNLCGFAENGEYISFFVGMLVKYDKFKIGMNLVNINKETLEIEIAEDISIDTQYIE